MTNVELMKKALPSDKDKVIKIICESFDTNPHVNTMIKNDKKRTARMVALAEYAFSFGIRRNGVYLTDDGLGVAIIFEQNKVALNFKEYYLQFLLIFKAITIRRALRINKLEKLIAQGVKRTISLPLVFWSSE
jgi:hypothetical protein